MTTHTHIRRSFAHRPVSDGFFSRLSHALGVWRQRRHLADLDETALSDIGLSRSEALAEAQRPVWDVPQHWRR